MGSRVYFTEIAGQKVYLLFKVFDRQYELSLFVDNRLVQRMTVGNGAHVLKHENKEVIVHISSFKLNVELKVDGKDVEFNNIKRKEIKAILTEAQIFNDVNPEVVPDEPFSFGSLIFPILVGAVGFLLDYFVTSSKFTSLISTILYGIAIALILSVFRSRKPFKNLEEPMISLVNLLHWVVSAFGAMFLSELIHKII